MQSVRVAVVGAGVVGLSTAMCIAESIPHCSLTVLAEHFSPNTTSDVAAGILCASLFPDIPVERQKRWFKDTFDNLLAISESSEAAEAGVFLLSGWQIFREIPGEKRPFWSEDVLGFRFMTGAELKRFPQHKAGYAFTTIKCECLTYLPWLQKRLRKAGVQFQSEKVTDFSQLCQHYDIIVNCSGLGSATLAGDKKLYPVRGQILKVQAPWLKNFIRDGDGLTYIYPGLDSVTLGGTRQADDWRLTSDARESMGIFDRCCSLEPSLKKSLKLNEWVGLRPSRKNLRLEKELFRLQNRQVPIVHNYGHGGWGVSLSWGTALETMRLVQQCIHERPLISRL
ncbi:D-aspartate oxidase [Lepisosteus oculatus]|uniref:D-aspartate oxidase n=1 Tax=Lepisosteus oculatus TaxID=7918 RepID=UPI0035F52A56